MTQKEKNIKKLLNYYDGEKDITKYKYIAMIKDKFLSGWGCSGENGHYQVILCNDTKEVHQVEYKTHNPKLMMRYTTFYNIETMAIPFKSDRSYSVKLFEQCPIFK